MFDSHRKSRPHGRARPRPSWLSVLASSLYASSVAGVVSANNVLSHHDHENRVYFAVELHDVVDPASFSSKYADSHNWTFEQPLGSLKNHYLFSVEKDAASKDLLHNMGAGHTHPNHHLEGKLWHNSVQTDESIHKRRLDHHQELVVDGLKSLQVLVPHSLSKRLPIPVPAPPVDSSLQVIQDAMDYLQISDPLFPKQWHLINPIQPGHDINVTGVWYQNVTGKGIAVAVVDDGLDMDHPDLQANYFADGSWDFNDKGPDPRPRLADDHHGTRCCGEIAAVRNEACGVGIAYDSKIAGIRILSKQISEAEEALALNYGMDKNDIYSCSWGPPDDGIAMAAPGLVVKQAILNGVQNGRNKLGSLFVFASGNGAANGDNCNFDGYTNSIYSITVAAIDRQGMHPFYSEACSANMVVTYSSGSSDKIVTTDVHGLCTDQHGGTSAAAPIAAGIFALVLEVRPDLTWRDLQYLAMDTAVPVNIHEPGWQKTSIGKQFHHKYGYGKLDTYAIVERAKTWQVVKPQSWFFSPKAVVNGAIKFDPDGANGGSKSLISVTADELSKANVERIEHVNVLVNIRHINRGSLTVVLTSPDGVKSELAAPRIKDQSADGIVDWTFMSVAHWGESGVGDWQLHVYNNKKETLDGELVDWTLKLWGEAKDASKARLFSLDEDNKPDNEVTPPASTSSPVPVESTTSPSPPPPAETTAPAAAPPPAETTTQPPSEPSTNPASVPGAQTTPTTTATATKKPGADDEKVPVISSAPSATTSAAATASATATPSSIWSLIPTFGLTGKTLSWVYGSILIIAGFVLGVVSYIFLSRRKDLLARLRGRQSNSSYEFDLIPSAAEADEERELFGVDDSDESDDDDDHHHHPDDGLPPRSPSPNPDTKTQKTGRGIYDTYAKSKDVDDDTEIFRVDTDVSDDDDDDEVSHGSTSSSTNHDADSDQTQLL
ncbi:kexin KEX2 [Sugiyamaella lignohabitans]|uniref:Kexin KEX2 n=1 Tax=Sugiyamaella lignohabitans TaxID=796027 RepID=A0A167F2Y9_9ASCO|nr:kexin KEX2 [Sugiyamaella lignohabitans]ANB14761.1 kexin KEX2 [Sugiyamaella lignohabitans]